MFERIKSTMRELRQQIALGATKKPSITVNLGDAQYARGYQRPNIVVAGVVCARGTHSNPHRNTKRKLVARMGIRQFKIQRRQYKALQGAI